jgi:hypothetical protein
MTELTTHTTTEGHVFRQIGKKLHSTDDQPAVIYADGSKWWYRDGAVHRDSGPAVVHANGVEEYWQNGKRHRIGGPAVIYPNASWIAPQLRGVQQFWDQGRMVREAVPPAVGRYRLLLKQAYQACFGAPPK